MKKKLVKKVTMRAYLNCQCQRKDGSWYSNPLTLSEVALIYALCKINDQVVVRRDSLSDEQYKATFGL